MINFKQDDNGLIDVTKKPGGDKPLFGETQEPASNDGALDEPITEVENFAKIILDRMRDENIPPTPNNYQLYFDRLLDEESKDFKKHIFEIMELEEASSSSEEQLYQLETKLKEDIGYIKKMLSTISTVYNNFNKMLTISKKREKELDSISNPLAIQNIANSLHKDLSTVLGMSKKQLLELKQLYAKSNTIIQEISAGSIFDQEFSGLYNQKYLISQIDKETKAISQFNHNSTIVFAKLSSKVTKEIVSKKGILLATRTVAKLFLKTSRRSDVIAHYGDGIFAMVLKYTDIENAKRATNRLEDLVTAAHFFFDDKDIELGISIGVAKILPIRTTDDTVKCVLTALKQVDANPNAYLAVCAGDENESEE